MKKIYISISVVLSFIVLLLFGSFFLLSKDGFPINASGHTIDDQGEIRKFSKGANYLAPKFTSKRLIEEKRKNITLDPSRLLFLENNEIMMMNKAVVVTDIKTIDELTSKTKLVSKENSYETSSKDGIKNVIPSGSIIKAAEERYLVLDEGFLTNGKDLNRRIEKNSLVIKNKDNRIKIISGNTVEEIASNDVYIELDNSIYIFELEDEILRLNEKEFLDLKLIKVDMNDQAQKFKSTKESTEASSSKETNSSSSTKNNSEVAKDEANETSISQENKNQQETSVSNNSNSPNQENQEGSSDESETVQGGNKLDQENLKSAVEELNQLNEGPGELPVVQAKLNIFNNKANFDIFVQDVSSYLKSLNLNILTMEGNQVSSTLVDKDKKRSRVSISDLKHGEQYQVVIEGSYKSKNGKEQKAIFYREIFTMDAIQLLLSVENLEKDSATILISSESDLSLLSSITLSYKENTFESSQKEEIELDITKLKETGKLSVVLEGLKSNTSYLTMIEQVNFQSSSFTDPKWYQVFSTLKKEASIESVELEYLSEEAIAKVTPVDLEDEDNSIQSIRYVLYEENDYIQNKEDALEIASTSTNNTGIYGSGNIPVKNIPSGTYLSVAYITGLDGAKEYQVISPPSNVIKIGGKEIPQALFDNLRPEQDRITFDYVVIDDDESLVFDQEKYTSFEIYEYINGVPVGEAKQSFKISNREQLKGTDEVMDKLKSSTEYVMIATAYYDLNNGDGVVRQEIGESEPFMTKPVEDVELNFELIKAQETTADIEIEALTSVEMLSELVVGIYKKDNLDKTIDKINIDHLLPALKENKKVTVTFEKNLESNTEYIVKADNSKDSGNNEIPVKGELAFYTAKKKPEADSVLAQYIEKDKSIEAVAGFKKSNTPIIDEQSTINKIQYTLINAKDPTSPITTKTVNENYQDIVKFSAPDEFVLGETYLVKAKVFYNNRYTDEEIDLTSESVITRKQIPTANIKVNKRDASGISMNIIIEDEDDAILNDSAKLIASGSTYQLKKGDNELVLNGANEISFEIIGETEITEGNKEKISFGKRTFRNFVKGEVSVATTAEIKEKRLAVDYKLNEFGKKNAVNSFESVKNAGETISTKKRRAKDGIFQSLNESLPFKNIYFDHQYLLDVQNDVNYVTNSLDYTGSGYNVLLSTSDGKNNVTRKNGNLILSGTTTDAEMYKWTSGKVDEKGNIIGTYFENGIEGSYLGLNGSKISDDFNSKQSIDLIKNDDGSYVLKYGDQYMNFASGTGVSNPKEATSIDLYSVSSQVIEQQLEITTPKLAEPAGKISVLDIGMYDVKLSFNLTDADQTFLKNKYGKELLKINFYEVDSGNKIASFDYDGTETQTFESLDSNTNYRIEVIGTYNLKDDTEDKEIKLFEEEILTKSAPPELLSSSFNWNSLENAHQIEGTLKIEDKDEVVQGMNYYLYALKDGLEFTSDPQEMQKRIENIKPILVNESKDMSTIFSIFDNEKMEQLYDVNQDYVILSVANTERLAKNIYPLASDKVFVSELRPIKWSIFDKNINRESTILTFNYSDLDGFIIHNPNKTINYILEHIKSGEEITSGSFDIGTEGEEDIDLGQLEENEEYMLKLTSQSNNLNGDGNVVWEVNKKILIDSFDLSLDAFYNKSYENMKLTTEHLNLNAKDNIKIKTLKTQLYKLENIGSAAENRVFMEEKIQLIPEKFPATFETEFDLENYETGSYLARSEIVYEIEGETRTKIYENWTYPVSHTKNSKFNIDINEKQNKLSLNVRDARLNKKQRKYKVLLRNQFNTVVDEKIVSAETLKKQVVFSELPSNQYTIEVFDGKECLTSVTYQTGQNKKISFIDKLLNSWLFGK